MHLGLSDGRVYRLLEDGSWQAVPEPEPEPTPDPEPPEPEPKPEPQP
jgi:hypothetical protein